MANFCHFYVKENDTCCHETLSLFPRNCIIGKNYVVKVSDHAMYCNRYENDYYMTDTKARLPIRWMAWESLLLVS